MRSLRLTAMLACYLGLLVFGVASAGAQTYHCTGRDYSPTLRHPNQTISYGELEITIPKGSRFNAPPKPLPGPRVPDAKRVVDCNMALTVAEAVITPSGHVNRNPNFHDGVVYSCASWREGEEPIEYFQCGSRAPYTSQVSFSAEW